MSTNEQMLPPIYGINDNEEFGVAPHGIPKTPSNVLALQLAKVASELIDGGSEVVVRGFDSPLGITVVPVTEANKHNPRLSGSQLL